MIPNATLRVVKSSDVADSAEFGISNQDSAHIMTILRDTLYSDKTKAVIREYSTNAWDEHRDCGKQDTPIKVTLPTAMEPVLAIRDFGRGMTHDEVMRIYSQYGASTKRNNDNTVGFLGIGSKSGFAYADSFTITSFNGGMKRTYVALLDPSEKGLINLLDEEPSPETGMEIQIAVKPEDIPEFEAKAKDFYQYFIPRPDINTALPALPSTQTQLKHGVIYDDNVGRNNARAQQLTDYHYEDGEWVVVMGCVAYHVDLSQLKNFDKNTVGIPTYFQRISGALFCNIGEVQINASREELKYNTETKKFLINKFNALVDEYVQHTLDNIETGNFTPWEKRVRARILSDLHLPVPKQWEDITAGNIELEMKDVKSISMWLGKNSTKTLSVRERTRLVLRDDTRALMGFRLEQHDYVIRLEPGKKWKEAEKELEALINAHNLQGITIVKSSTLPWVQPTKTSDGKTINPKHYRRTFRLKPDEVLQGRYYRGGKSALWESVKRKPEASDVFVVLYEFKAQGNSNFFHDYKEDLMLAKLFGRIMPEIYGYKTTAAKPVDPKKLKGHSYEEWRKGFAKALLNKKVQWLLNHYQWSQVAGDNHHDGHTRWKNGHKEMIKRLGRSHPITIALKLHYRGVRVLKDQRELNNGLESLIGRLDAESLRTLGAHKTMEAIKNKYPLLGREDFDLMELWDRDSKAWIHYVKSVDRAASKS